MGFPSETKRASLLLKVLFAFALTTLIQCTAKMINGTDDTFTP